MRVTQQSRRWFVPVAAVAVIGAGAAFGPAVADASPDLPDITAQQLLANVQTAKVDGLSGTVKLTADLGLPALPASMSGPSQSELTDLLSGKHTVRVAYAAPDKARVAVLDTMSERVLVTDGRTAWAYDSREHRATKSAVPAHPDRPARPQLAEDPQTLAKQFLDAVDPSTKVTVTGTRSVAGRDAYLLTLTPRTDRTTVGSVTLAVDAKTWMPLRTTVMPRAGGKPAIEIGFTDVSFATPDASTFAFTPPKGTKVTDDSDVAAVPNRPFRHRPDGMQQHRDHPRGAPTVIGTGWDAVVVTRWNADSSSDGVLRQLLAKAPSASGSWGTGKVLSSRMVSALFTDDGRLLVGLVPPSVLEQAAAKAPR
jgi:outer membrane lipoprotein-sorting protein